MFKDAAEAAQLLSTYSVNANDSASSIGRNFALNEILNNLASDRVKTIAESVGTPAVARDMLSIVEAFGQEKLQYWGISLVSIFCRGCIVYLLILILQAMVPLSGQRAFQTLAYFDLRVTMLEVLRRCFRIELAVFLSMAL